MLEKQTSKSVWASYTLDLYLAFIIRGILLLGAVVIISTGLAGCGTTDYGSPSTKIETAALPPISAEGSRNETRNIQPQGGAYEKSDRSPCGPVE